MVKCCKCHFKSFSLDLALCFLNKDGSFEGGSAVLPTQNDIFAYSACAACGTTASTMEETTCSNTE